MADFEKFPYQRFEQTRVWLVLEDEISKLVDNQDLSLTTASRYVTGSICKRLSDEGLLAAGATTDRAK